MDQDPGSAPDERRGFRRPVVLLAIGASILLAIGALYFFFMPREPSLPGHLANGTFEHDCCGTIEFRDGTMYANGMKWTGYIVQQDEMGPYILPNTYVGTENDRGMVYDGSRQVRKLRLDRIPNPTRIEIPRINGSFVFNQPPPWRRATKAE